jgi:hypothetical protein
MMRKFLILPVLFFTANTFAQMGDCDDAMNGIFDSIITKDYALTSQNNGEAYNASSYSKDKDVPLKYSPDKVFDGNIQTAWVEGAADEGLGEKLAFIIPEKSKSISIMPGLGIEKYFKMNNRVKTAKLVIYNIKEPYATQCYTALILGDIIFEKELSFTDEMKMQNFDLGLVTKEQTIAVLTITSVYDGSKWDDTCISEITIKQ